MSKGAKKIPGSIFVRKGTNKLTIKLFGRQYATGCPDTGAGWDLAHQTQAKLYLKLSENRKVQERFDLYSELDIYMTYLRKKGREEKTIKGYEYSIKRIFPENVELKKKIVESGVEKFVRLNEKLSGASFSIYLRSLKVFLKHLKDFELIDWELNFKRWEFSIKHKKIVWLENDEFVSLLSTFRQSNNYDKEFENLLLFLWHTGARIKETLQLTFENVDFIEQILYFCNKIDKQKEEIFPITSVLNEILKFQKQKNNKDNKVFRWSENSVSRLTKKLTGLMKATGLKYEGNAFHIFRKSFATRLYHNNLPLQQFHDLMRHKDMNTSKKHYIGKKAGLMRDSLENVDGQSMSFFEAGKSENKQYKREGL